jgi:hypothetical protein
MNSILPRNRYVEFDIEDYLAENSLAEVPVEDPASMRTPQEMPS